MNRDLLEGAERLMKDLASSSEPQGETDQAQDDALWEALSFGTLTESEARDLEVESRNSAAQADHYEAYRPVDSATKNRWMEQIAQGLESRPVPEPGESSSVEAREPQPESPDSTATEEDGAKSGRILPWSSRGWFSGQGRWSLPKAALALAACLVWFLWPRPSIVLPDFEVTGSSGSQKLRSEAPDYQGHLSLEPGDSFELILRPAQAIERALGVLVFAESPAGLVPLQLASEVSQSGSVRISGRADRQLTGGNDTLDLRIVLAPPGSMPEIGRIEARLRGETEKDPEWKLIRYRIQIDGERSP